MFQCTAATHVLVRVCVCVCMRATLYQSPTDLTQHRKYRMLQVNAHAPPGQAASGAIVNLTIIALLLTDAL